MCHTINIASFVVVVAIFSMAILVRPLHAQCSWQYNGTSVTCSLVALDPAGLDLADAEGAQQLRIACSEVYLFESQLPAQAFARLGAELRDLTIDGCHLLQLPSTALSAVRSLRRLTIRTRNAHWGPARSLDLPAAALDSVRDLHELHLGENNIRALPPAMLCRLPALQVLNMTANRLRSAAGLIGGGCDRPSELRTLDLSYNELQVVPEEWTSGPSALQRLQHLHMQSNNISVLAAHTLAALPALRVLDVGANRLEQLPGGLFDASRELRELRLPSNALYELPAGLFHRCDQLVVLDVSDNQLASPHISARTFAGLVRLIVLDMAHNALTRIAADTFAELYVLQILNLRNNSIGHVEEGAFASLYNLHTLNLAENRLHQLNDHLFDGLFVLAKLTLNNNLINAVQTSVFRNCTDLKELDLSANRLTEVPLALRDLPALRSLDLGENLLTTIENGSFAGLGQLTGLRLIENHIGNITVGMFADLPRLSVLNLAKNRIQHIDRYAFLNNTELEAIRLDRNFLTDINGVFAQLAALLWLNLSENHMVWFDYAFVPRQLKWLDIHGNYIETLANYYKLQEELHITTMDASHNRISELGPLSVPNTIELLFVNNNHIRSVLPNTFIDKTQLQRVDMYANALEQLAQHTLRLAPVPEARALPEFYLGGNPFECDCGMEWLQRANNQTQPRQHPLIADLVNIECRMPHAAARGEPQQRPLLQLAAGDFLCPYATHCFALCHCCDFDACDCEQTCPEGCTCWHDQTWSTNVVDCGLRGPTADTAAVLPLPPMQRIPMDATALYLDGQRVPELRANTFIGRKHLRELYANATGLERLENRTFNGLPTLLRLHLEDNRLAALHGREFDGATGLRELYLQNNQLRTVAARTFAQLAQLRVLRLDGNQLMAVGAQPWQLAEGLRSLRLAGNAFGCGCRQLQELHALVAEQAGVLVDTADIRCVDALGVRRELDFNVTAAAETVCNELEGSAALADSVMLHGVSVRILAAALAAALLVVAVLVLTLVFRVPLRRWFASAYPLRGCHSADDDEAAAAAAAAAAGAEKLYDAVLLHSAGDASAFVFAELCGELELGRPALRLCVQHRDCSDAQIIEAARAARRVCVVLSRSWLQTEWSRPELRRAVHESVRGRLHKLVLVVDDVSANGGGGGVAADVAAVLLEAEQDVDLQPYLRAAQVQRVRRSDRLFWEKLRYALPAAVATDSDLMAYRGGNQYTIDASATSAVHHMQQHPHHIHHHIGGMTHSLQHQHLHQHQLLGGAGGGTLRKQQPASPGVLFRQQTLPHHHQQQQQQQPQPPPAYYAASYGEADDANYSSATTATPSPRPERRRVLQQQQQQQQTSLQRPPSEHIYTSIDSDYGGVDDGADARVVVGVHGGRSSWRVSTNPHELHEQQQQQQQQQHTHGPNEQAYLV